MMASRLVVLCTSLSILINHVNGEWLGLEDHLSRWDEYANTQGTSLLDQFADDIEMIGNGITAATGKDGVQSFLDPFYAGFDNVKYTSGDVIEDIGNAIAFDYSVYYYKSGCYNDILTCKAFIYFDENGLMNNYNYICPPDKITELFAATLCEGGGEDIILPPYGKGPKGAKGAKGASAYIDDKNFMQIHDIDVLNNNKIYEDPLFVALNVLCLLLGGMVISLVTYIICDRNSKKKKNMQKIHDGNKYETTVDVSDTDI